VRSAASSTSTGRGPEVSVEGSRPTHLGVEHLGNGVLGLGERCPRLSWRLPQGAQSQLWYRIEVDGQSAETAFSDQCVLVPWPVELVGSRQRVVWRVKVATDLGESAWSEPAWFETGLLDPADWVARWVEPFEEERGAHVLRSTFRIDGSPPVGRLYATSHGIYETFLNGRRVGDIELAPGFTGYETRLQVQVYDVSDLFVAGVNSWKVVLSDGWYRGRTAFTQFRDGYGDRLAFLGQLHVGDHVFATGPDWESATGRIVTADLMAGQVEDRRRRPSDWMPVVVRDHDIARLVYSPAPPTRRVQEIRPVSVCRLTSDRQIVDLGQNINGWVRLKDLGPAGASLALVHGEALDPAGDVTQEHLAAIDFVTGERLSVGQTDQVISDGTEGAVFEPRQTTHGFQYVRIEGHPDRLTPDDIDGVVVHTDLQRIGWFRCSDERLNRLHDIAEWSFRDNACEIPTDCPQRERAGWTGDWQVFTPSAAFLYDVAGFSLKWLRDVAAEQLASGAVTNFVPDPHRHLATAEKWPFHHGAAGWGDAIVMVPWELWRAYGDGDVLVEMWPSMVAWLDFAERTARNQRHLSQIETRPEPGDHEVFIWDSGFHWGEHTEPGEFDLSFRTANHGAVATAFLQHSATLMACIGNLLGRTSEAERYEALSANVLKAWREEFILPDGSLTPDTQANHVRALAFELVPDALRERTAARLVELIREAGTHLGTGFLATPYLLPVLADTGHLDVAYEVLFQDTPPSWLHMVERGATTIWETWEGPDTQGVSPSLNHYSKGAVISFLHRYVAGIRLLNEGPAYKRFRVQPQPGGGLTWAEAIHDSPYGRIESSWRLVEGGNLRLTVTVPPGCTASVVLADGAVIDQGSGTATYLTQLDRASI
jgi:alpha-L-rhamnosidase